MPNATQDGLVKLARYATEAEAQLQAIALGAEGIETQIFGGNTSVVNGFYWQNFNDVELFVRAQDGPRALQILAQTDLNDMEPVEPPVGAPPPVDEHGLPLVPVAAFASANDLNDAQTVLASANIRSLGPPLEKRGDRPPGQGNRFILLVAANDLESAQTLLDAEADDDADEPRCPNCGSWRTREVTTFLRGLAAIVGVNSPPRQMECLACHYQGDAAEFVTSRAQ